MTKLALAAFLLCAGLARADSLSPLAFNQRFGKHHVYTASYREKLSLINIAKRFIGDGNPTGFRGPWCGAFMGMVARKAGKHVPQGYLQAKSWLRAGAHVRPTSGVIGVFARRHGGHVGIVTRVERGRVQLLSGNHGHKVALGWYPTRLALAFVKLD